MKRGKKPHPIPCEITGEHKPICEKKTPIIEKLSVATITINGLTFPNTPIAVLKCPDRECQRRYLIPQEYIIFQTFADRLQELP